MPVLIVRDRKQGDMLAYATFTREKLGGYYLIATATTEMLLSANGGLDVESSLSEPMTGEVQIAARVATANLIVSVKSV